MPNFTIKWHDRGREAAVAPNPDYPNGIDLNTTQPGETSCRTELPYPAKRIGVYVVTCNRCGATSVVTTAGRPDDPRSLTMPCKTGEAA